MFVFSASGRRLPALLVLATGIAVVGLSWRSRSERIADRNPMAHAQGTQEPGSPSVQPKSAPVQQGQGAVAKVEADMDRPSLSSLLGITDPRLAWQAGKRWFFGSEEELMRAVQEALATEPDAQFIEGGPVESVFIPRDSREYVCLSFRTLDRLMSLALEQQSLDKRRFVLRLLASGLRLREGRAEDQAAERSFLASANRLLLIDDRTEVIVPLLAALSSGLTRIHDGALLETVRRLATDPDRTVPVRSGAIPLVSREAAIWDQASLAAVESLLQDPDPRISEAVATTLPWFAADPDALPAARDRILAAVAEWVRRAPPEQLRQTGEFVVAPFAERMKGDRGAVIRGLTHAGVMERSAALCVILQGSLDGQLGADEAESILAIAGGEDPAWVRSLAIRGLLHLGLQDAYAGRTQRVAEEVSRSDTDPGLRAEAKDVLEMIRATPADK